MKNRTTCIDESLLARPSESDERVRVLQRKLYVRAKREKGFKGYSLYDKICQDYFLLTAYHRVKHNYSKGVGVDGQSFAAIEEGGVLDFLTKIQQDLQVRRYRCSPVRQVLIPKETKGEYRKLGIPTIRDRVVQMAVKMAIEPLWEADFCETSYGFRPKKSARDAIRQVKENIYAGHKFVYDADLSKYFDTIPHGKLFKLLKQRVKDGGILDLIQQWLTAPVQLLDGTLESSKEGTPQGGVISPLLSNIYLHAFDRIVNNPDGKFARAGIRMVRYADDWLLMGKWYFSKSILRYIDQIMSNMGLKLNKEKTRLLHINKSSLFFLGFEFRSIPSKFTWNHRNYTNIQPSIKSRSKLFSVLKELFRKRKHWTIEWIVWKLNPVLRGWLNYFSISKVSHIWDTIRVIKQHLSYKLYKWMKGKGRKAHRKLRQRPYENLVKFYGLLDLEEYARLKTLSKAE
ncbi:group II intron reverse transcriptase/maturase [Marinoscillum furvescens]|uniref:Group II intron reverse transcriptase/maturase n=1 Tax=Marinoscillum furvescens DSM 4134 TaxID=1122208 RepID=A0A3D9KVG3_MARFU|nr:group II intron reverse transcriptase/maturase [Marinoscillum furvescens]RED91215.1 group II intron reverse transcriptase/maturase [Marinoscillum furvescens DSM 4134]